MSKQASSIKYTKLQRAAIQNHYPGSLLVSASAGSGKTRVLVARVVHWLCSRSDRRYRHEIDHLLIVTFTRAAAKEMQDRIRRSLRRTLNQTSDPALADHLIRQLRKLPVAHISTLDAFCQWIVGHYYYVIGFDPRFRLLTDSTEVGLLRDSVWQTVREDLYAHDPRFGDLVRNFSGSRVDSDDGVTDLVNRVYDYANVRANPQKWLKTLPNLYRVHAPLVRSQLFQKFLLPLLQERVLHMKLVLKRADRMANQYHLKKEAVCLQDDVAFAARLDRVFQTSTWNELRQIVLKTKFSSFPRASRKASSDQKMVHGRVLDLRNAGKKIFKSFRRFFALDESDNLKIIRRSRELIVELVKAVRQFAAAYQKSKVQRRALEFVDVEHAALKILRSNRNDGSVIRHYLQDHFAEIMVDEYQDDNHLQDAILTTIARKRDRRPANMFMVGDVKQSIYRFRLADPRMFLEKQVAYQRPGNQDRLIRLADNFRSTANIDAFVNLIFDQIMDRQVGKIQYYPHHQLRYGHRKINGNPQKFNFPVRVMIYDGSEHPDPINQLGHNRSEPVNPRFQIDSNAQGQIEMIAQKIQQLVNNPRYKIYDHQTNKERKIRYSDVALISATRNNDLVIADLFKAHRIPVTIEGEQSYFKTTEIQIMVSLLQVIDNPYQDIPLVAVLRSPIVGLDENQLAYLRINSRTGDYYRALVNFARNYGTAKYAGGHTAAYGDQIYRAVRNFLKLLDQLRNVAEQHGLVELIWTIYQRTGFLDYVGGMPAGRQRQANLHALYERAADYEKSSFRGLFQFIRFIQRMQERNNDLAESAANQNPNTVLVITIHGSKGLEFPVVFFYDASHDFNQRDYRQSAVIDDLGVGINYYAPQKYVHFRTLPKQVIAAAKKRESLAEEMRKLYVVLTRAEQRLYVVGMVKNYQTRQSIISGWESSADGADLVLPDTTLRSARNDLDWLGAAMCRHPNFQLGPNRQVSSVISQNPVQFTVQFVSRQQLMRNVPARLRGSSRSWLKRFKARALKADRPTDAAKLNRLMNFRYPNLRATRKAAYQSVSEIKQLFGDPDEARMAKSIGGNDSGRPVNQYMVSQLAVPQFMQQANTKPRSTEVGTATHLIFQMLPLDKTPTADRIAAEIRNLTAKKMITAPVAKLIDREGILAFFRSPIGKKVVQHPNGYHRERPFSLLVNANRIFPTLGSDSTDRVLVHGIIDGFLDYYESGRRHVILVDYKTDFVNPRHPTLDVQKIKRRYRGQLNLYALALRDILRMPVHRKYLYLVKLRKFVQV